MQAPLDSLPITIGIGERPSEVIPASASARGCAALEAGDGKLALRWLARARRLAPEDHAVLFLLAATAGLDDPARALALLDELVLADPRHRDAHFLQVALLQRSGRKHEAANALARLLSRLPAPDTISFRDLARRVCQDSDAAGWVGVSSEGAVLGDLDGAVIVAGGRTMSPHTVALAEHCKRANILNVSRNGRVLLGSPVDLRAIRRPVVRTAPARPVPIAPPVCWREGRRTSSIALVTHNSGGGVERHIAARVRAIESQGLRAIVLRPGVIKPGASKPGGETPPDISLSDGSGPVLLSYAADRMIDLAELLRDDGCCAIEFHHWAAHAGSVRDLPRLLGVPYRAILHDYAAICPRVTLCGGNLRFCGEPADVRDCEDCITDHGARMPFSGSVRNLRRLQYEFLAGAETVTVPSLDLARRVRRYMPHLNPIVQPWEDDSALTTTIDAASGVSGPVHVALVGALGLDKGFDILLACVRDAQRRALDLRFTVVGHTIDDDRLMEAGPVFVTGRFEEGQAQALLEEDPADIGFLPSVWPETWCFALSALWQAGLPVIAFDLGAQAERIRKARAGSVLPLGLPASRINDVLTGSAIARRRNVQRLRQIA